MTDNHELILSDYIAILATLIAFLSAHYTRQARDASRRANEIAIYAQRRPARLAAYQSMASFAHYCSQYFTFYCMKEVLGTRNLISRIDVFKAEINQQGIIDIPEVERKFELLINSAWQLQRLIDRLETEQIQSTEHKHGSTLTRDQIYAIVDLFSGEEHSIKELFRKFL
jgi:hypothetical protein